MSWDDWDDDEEEYHEEASNKFLDKSSGELIGKTDDLLRGFFDGAMDFTPQYTEEHKDINNVLKELDKLGTRISNGRNQRDDFIRFFKDNEHRKNWRADELLSAIERSFDDYSSLVRQQSEEIRERSERERRRENEERNATRAAKDVKFQHEGGRPDFIPNGSKQLDNGTWKAPDGRIFRRSTTHEWTDGDNRYSDEDRRPVNASPQLEGVYAYSRTPWGSYIMVFVVVIIIVIILFH